MLSHIADETRSLAHGFLGALFSVILVFSDEDQVAVFCCCCYLYGLFILVTAMLHYILKSKTEKGDFHYGVTISLLAIFTFVGYGLCLAVFGFGASDLVQIQKMAQIRIGILVYGAFLVVMMFANLNIMKASREVAR